MRARARRRNRACVQEAATQPVHVRGMKRRWIAVPLLLLAAAGTASAQTVSKLSITTPALQLAFPTPAPGPARLPVSALAITTAALSLAFPTPAPAGPGAPVSALKISTSKLELDFPTPAPVKK